MMQLGIEALSDSRLVVDADKLRAVATRCIDSGFAWVAERSGRIVAAVCALVHEMTFYYGNQASVVQFYTTVPGEGITLMRRFVQWAKARNDVRMYCFSLEADADPRLSKLMERLGLSSRAPVYLEIKP